MMELAIVFLSIVLLMVFTALHIFVRKEINNITEQLREINRINTNSKVTLTSSNKAIKKLALEINKTLEERQKSEIQYRKMDLELRHAIANISHDLRTPLTSIIGYMQLLDNENIPPEERKEYLDIIKRRTETLQVLINSFYDLSRLEAGEYILELKPLNMVNLIYDLLALYYKDFTDKNIEPQLDIDENIPLIIGDENAVIRIFSNLLENALKYGENLLSIEFKEGTGKVITTFINDAPNLKEEDVDRLFDRFFTADVTRSAKNTGLGLAIVKELVHQMGYEIYGKLIDGKVYIIIEWKI